MNTKLVKLTRGSLSKEDLLEAGQIIKDGGLVAFPTETVYGLGGDALNPTSSQKIYAAKGRPSDNPLIVHIANWDSLTKIVADIPAAAKQLADAFWPGPMTLIFQKSDLVPYETTGGLDTVAVRMPSDEVALAFIEAAGGYVAAPSANLSGKPSPTDAAYVMQDMDGRIEMVLDGGDADIGLESTIVDLTEAIPMILRPGFITKEDLEHIVGTVLVDPGLVAEDVAPKAPGMKYRHYAPTGDLTIVEGNQEQVVSYINSQIAEAKDKGLKTAVIATDETLDFYEADFCFSAGTRQSQESIAKHLYRILRKMDDEQAQIIYAESFYGEGLAKAIMNRLLKAAGHKVISLTQEEK